MARAVSRRPSLVSLTGEDMSKELLEFCEALQDIFGDQDKHYILLHNDSLSAVVLKPAANNKKAITIKFIKKSFALNNSFFVHAGPGRGYVLRDLLRYEQGEQSLPKLVGHMEHTKFHVILTKTYGCKKPSALFSKINWKMWRNGESTRFVINMVDYWRVAVGLSAP